MTSINTPEAVTLKLQNRSTDALINDLVLSGKMMDRKNHDPNLPTVRGWLLDELENRNTEAFEAWLDSDSDDDELPMFYQFSALQLPSGFWSVWCGKEWIEASLTTREAAVDLIKRIVTI